MQSSSPPVRTDFVGNLECDEIRNCFLVTSHRKKSWNVQLNMIKEVDRICKKYDIRYFAFYGTLLGAVRHKGFVPWDHDSDFVMLNPDYHKFLQVAAQEIKPPYFFDVWYNYKLESEGATLENTGDNFQFLSLEHEKARAYDAGLPFRSMIRIRDSRTTMIQWGFNKNINQGIWIDIFPFDSAPPFENKQQSMNTGASRELFLATILPNVIKDAMDKKQTFLFDNESLKKFLKLPYDRKAVEFEQFRLDNHFESKYVAELRDVYFEKNYNIFERKDFNDVIYMPFEKIEIPCPVGYENILTTEYGDWRKPVIFNTNESNFSADIPYTEFYKKSAFMR